MPGRIDYEDVGDNKEVTIPTAGTTVVFHFQSTNTSTSDTTTAKYFDNISTSIHKFQLRTDQTIHIVGMNGTTFTDPITVAKDSNYTEKDSGIGITQMTVLTFTANNILRLRAL